jgi:mRNA interferase HigB
MRIISIKMLKDHWALPNRGDSEEPLKAWHAIAKEASWDHFAQVKEQFRSASAVGDRVVLNNTGNKKPRVSKKNKHIHTN